MDHLNLARRFGESLREAPVKIFAGAEKKVYYVHSGILSAWKSSTAGVHLNGPWKDTDNNAIDWTDFDEQTVECVLQFLYTGDYHIPRLEMEADMSGDEHLANGVGRTEGDSSADKTRKTTGSYMLSQSPPAEADIPLRPLTPFQHCTEAGFPAESKQTAAGTLAEADFELDKWAIRSSVLEHARVYSFAHQHFFSDLARLALQRLTQVLDLAPCDHHVLFPHFGEAIRRIYDTTPGREMQPDPARKLLSQYVALNFTRLACEEFNALVEEGGEFMVDVSNKLVRLLAMKESQASSLEDRIGTLSTKMEALQIVYKLKEVEIKELRSRQEGDESDVVMGVPSAKKQRRKGTFS